MHNRAPNIQRLTIHFSQQQTVTFRDSDNLQHVVKYSDIRKTILMAWFQENLKNPTAHIYKYINFLIHYTWNMSLHK